MRPSQLAGEWVERGRSVRVVDSDDEYHIDDVPMATVADVALAVEMASPRS